MLRSVNIIDDRGRRVPLVAHEVLLASTERSRRLRDASNLPRGKPTSTEVRRGVVVAIVALPLMALATLGPLYAIIRLRPPTWAMIPLLLGVCVVPAAITFVFARWIGARRIASIYRRAGMCASCGYDLLATESESDGCRVCPECGAAWRLSDATSASPASDR